MGEMTIAILNQKVDKKLKLLPVNCCLLLVAKKK